ncbi:MAG: hypothetical protein HOE19_00125 [Candidatus Komeilibacteria bacterium]|jgi:O-antigen ligase/tetratricopeptide (TPR) repeat protein|nr:hypothetical protein [Candidatus Komeilibacteria bacterium]MBT4448014.1 hypothetical protein [Candidatus Komeilibacteria bacterium]
MHKNLEKYGKYLLFLIPILPLLFIDGYFYPFVLMRAVFFRSIILIALAIFLYIAFKDKGALIHLKIKQDKIFVLFTTFVAIMFTTSIFGTHFYNSFFATLERLQGVVYWLFLLVYILLLKFYFRTSKDWMAFFKITILVSFVASIYAILQKFSLIDVFHSGIDRAEGTLGNAAFLGSYLLLAVILGFWLFLREQNKIWKYSILIINLFNIFVLYLTLTRSALLALLVFFTVWIFTGASSFSRKYKMISRGVLALMLILVVLSIIFRDYLANLDNDIINRLFVISLDSPVIKNRLLVWQGALQNIGNYFWLGLGMNNFDVLFNKYFHPGISEDWFDRSHNAFLDIFIMTGIFGLLNYLFLIVYSMWILIKNRAKDILLYSTFFALLAAHSVNNLFVFDTLNTSFILLAVLAFISFKFLLKSEEPQTGLKEVPKDKPWLKPILFLVALLIPLAFYYVVYQPAMLNKNTYKGVERILINKEASYKAFSKHLGYKFASNEIAFQTLTAFDILESNNPSVENKIRFKELTYNSFKEAHKFYPQDVRINMHMAQFIINNYSDIEKINEAIILIEEAKELSPNRPEVYYLLGQTYIIIEEVDKTIVVLKDLMERLPTLADPKFILANILYSQDKEAAQAQFNEAINMEYNKNVLNYQRIIEFYLAGEDYEAVLPYYLDLINLKPEDYRYKIDLAQVYYFVNDLESAVEQINIIQNNAPELIPQFQEAVDAILGAYNKSLE